jgi:hypothetical protein
MSEDDDDELFNVFDKNAATPAAKSGDKMKLLQEMKESDAKTRFVVLYVFSYWDFSADALIAQLAGKSTGSDSAMNTSTASTSSRKRARDDQSDDDDVKILDDNDDSEGNKKARRQVLLFYSII